MAILNKNIGIIGHFLKDRDFIGNIGNIGTLEGLEIVNNQILYKFTFRFKSSEKKKYLYASNFRRTI